MKPFYFLALFLLVGMTACKSSKSTSNSESAARVAYDDFAPEAMEAVLTVQETKVAEGAASIYVEISDVIRKGRTAPGVATGQAMWLDVAPSIMNTEAVSNLSSGEKLTALLEYSGGGLGQEAAWKLISIK